MGWVLLYIVVGVIITLLFNFIYVIVEGSSIDVEIMLLIVTIWPIVLPMIIIVLLYSKFDDWAYEVRDFLRERKRKKKEEKEEGA